MPQTLQVIVLVRAAVVVVLVAAACCGCRRSFGYRAVGTAVGPGALGLVPDTAKVRSHRRVSGIVFLMFSIGLEFRLPQAKAMRLALFGVALAQAAITPVLAMISLQLFHHGWLAGLAPGGALAMRSTAIVSEMLVERRELRAARTRCYGGSLVPGSGRHRISVRHRNAGERRRRAQASLRAVRAQRAARPFARLAEGYRYQVEEGSRGCIRLR